MTQVKEQKSYGRGEAERWEERIKGGKSSSAEGVFKLGIQGEQLFGIRKVFARQVGHEDTAVLLVLCDSFQVFCQRNIQS